MSVPDSGVDLRTPSDWQRNDPEPREERRYANNPRRIQRRPRDMGRPGNMRWPGDPEPREEGRHANDPRRNQRRPSDLRRPVDMGWPGDPEPREGQHANDPRRNQRRPSDMGRPNNMGWLGEPELREERRNANDLRWNQRRASDSGIPFDMGRPCDHEPREDRRNANNPRRNQRRPRNRLSSTSENSSDSGRPRDYRDGPRHIGDLEFNDPDIVDRVLLEHEVSNPMRLVAGGVVQQQNAERNEPVIIQQNEDLTVESPLLRSSERPRSDFWPEGIWTWNCVDRCMLFLFSIALTIVGFAGLVISLNYFKRPVGWALISVSTAGAGIFLIKKTLKRLCCP